IIFRLVAQLYVTTENPIDSLAKSFLGQVYIALPMASMNILFNYYGSHILLALFIFIWVNDTGAFCVGSLIGKNRLFERISPKKSWEGFFGGFIAVLAVSAIISLYFNNYFTGLTLTEWLILGGISSIFATWGDLNESLIKRTVNVKDSGKILPGHGGMLDRIDSLLLVVPATLIILIIIKSTF
ncbi:MAG: phosphatidate cytidylyltransferase, partial [Bacteroidales bacterium]